MSQPTPSPMPTPDLGSILRLHRADPAASTDADVQTTAAPHETAPAPARRPTNAGTATEKTSAPRTDGVGAPVKQYLRPMHIQIPRSLHQQLRDTAQAQGTTATALLLAAVNATHHQLGTALATSAPATDGPGLFAVPQARKAAEPTVATTIRVTDSQLEALDALAREHGTDRSRILATATRLYLDQ